MVRRWLAASVALAVVAAACGNDDDDDAALSPDGDPAEIDTLQVGYIPILGFAPFFVAEEKGYFEDVGLDVELEEFVSGDPMVAPLSQGQLDVGGGEFGPALMNAVDQDLDVRVVSGLASQPQGFPAVPLLVSSAVAEEVATPADLAGRQVAINVERGMAEYLLNAALETEGLTLDDVEVTNIPFPEMLQALANNAVDAAILPHPLAGSALAEGDAEVLVDGDQITDTPQNGVVYFGQQLLAEENSEVGVRFLEAYLRAARDLFGEGWRAPENAEAISAWTEVPAEVIQQGAAYFFEPDGVINDASLEDIGAYHVDQANADLDEPLPLDAVVTTEFLDDAVERAGEFEQP